METIKHILGLCDHTYHINIFTLIATLLIIKLTYEAISYLVRNLSSSK